MLWYLLQEDRCFYVTSQELIKKWSELGFCYVYCSLAEQTG